MQGIRYKERTMEALKTGNEPGQIHPPLLDLSLHNIIPDELHLLLRITDRLIENLMLPSSMILLAQDLLKET